MADVIPFEKPEVEVSDLHGGMSFSATCLVPDCDWTKASEMRSRIYRSVREHKAAHRTALGSGGGPQLTIFDALGVES